MVKKESMADVVLHIYDVTKSGSEKTNKTIAQINRLFKDGIGLGGIFHSAIQVYGDDEWSYGYCEQGTGVSSCPSGKNPAFTYREKIVLGRTDCTIVMVNQIMRELSRQWPGKKYDLLSKNSNHFCNVLCDRLGVPKIPDKAIILECTESMTNTGSVDIKATIDTVLPWKTAVKGSRSSTRRTKKKVARPATLDIEAECKSSACTTAAKGESESEKLGVSVLGQHFAERVEHVPIKKRRFMVSSPSPLNRSSTCSEGSQYHAEVNHALPVSRLNPNLMGLKTAEVTNDKPDCSSHDFSGIKILAEVACNSGMSSDIASVVESQPLEPVQQQNASTLSTHVEGNESSTGTVDVSGKDSTIESGDRVGEGKSEIIESQKVLVDQSDEHGIVTSSGMIVDRNISIAVSNESSAERPKENMEVVGDSVVPQSETVAVSGHLSDDERTGKGKITECLTDDRLLWDLNLPTDAWGQPCDVVDEASQRYSDGEVTESVKESGHVDGSKDYAAGLIVSDVHVNSASPSRPKAETCARNEEFQSSYDSQFEDGEWREPYPWAENEGDSEDVEQVDYGSEPENERFHSLADSNENKLDVNKGILAEKKCGAVKSESGNVHEGNSDTEKHVVVCMNDSHSKGSSPSRSFGSRPFRSSHETIPRRRPGSNEELSERNAGPSKFVGRDRSGMRMRSRSPVKGQFGAWDSKRRFSLPIYKGGPYGFGRSHPKISVEGRDMMNDFDQRGRGRGRGPGPQGYVGRQFLNRGYRGRFRRFPDGGGYREFRGVDRPFPSGDGNEYRSRMHNNRMNGKRDRSNSPPVFSRLNDPQSRSRSRSRSPGSWNRRNRSPPGFKGDESKMERVRCPFPKRFPQDQEMGFMSPPRNQRNSRFSDGRNNDGAGGENHQNNLRGRSSPSGRMFRPEQRFDSMRRVNSESNHFRPFMRHNYNNNNRRFVDGGGSRGRGFKYAAAEETNVNRYEMVHRPFPQRSDAVKEDGDNIRGFRFDADQQHTVVSNNNNSNETS